jgi:hypothetical protein
MMAAPLSERTPPPPGDWLARALSEQRERDTRARAWAPGDDWLRRELNARAGRIDSRLWKTGGLPRA